MPPDAERRIIDECYRFGEELPDNIKKRPSLHLGLDLYFNAWFELDTERNHNNGLQRISRSMCFAYAQDYQLTEEQRDDLWYYVRTMDDTHLNRLRIKMKPSKPSKGKPEG